MRLFKNIKLLTVATFVALFCVGGGLSSCVLSEKVGVVVLYTPQMHTYFAVDQSLVRIEDARVFVYSAEGLLLRDTTFTAAELYSPDPLLIIKGVADGQYQMVALYNTAKMVISGTKLDTSRIEELRATLPDLGQEGGAVEVKEIDSLCHSFVPFTVQRGTPTLLTTQIAPAHYFVTVKVSGIERLTVPAGQIGVQLLDLPFSIGSQLNVCDRFDVEVKLNDISPDERYGECMALMFRTADKAKLRVLEDGHSIQTLAIEPERYFSAGTPANRLNIEVVFYANSYVILVNDWKLGEFELINVGG